MIWCTRYAIEVWMPRHPDTDFIQLCCKLGVGAMRDQRGFLFTS